VKTNMRSWLVFIFLVLMKHAGGSPKIFLVETKDGKEQGALNGQEGQDYSNRHMTDDNTTTCRGPKNQVYKVGERIPNENPCESCECSIHGELCMIQDCAPLEPGAKICYTPGICCPAPCGSGIKFPDVHSEGVKFPDVHSEGKCDCKEECHHWIPCRASFCGEGGPKHQKCLNECNAWNDCKARCFKWTLCRAGFCGEGGPLHTECLDECKTEQGLQDRQMTDGQCLGQDNKKQGQDYAPVQK